MFSNFERSMSQDRGPEAEILGSEDESGSKDEGSCVVLVTEILLVLAAVSLDSTMPSQRR